MKLMIGEYEVEIKAKDTRFNSRCNLDDTMNLLNTLSIYASEARNYYRTTNADALAKMADTYGRDIYTALNEKGCYKNV